ncbi:MULTISPECIES: hypothetical protein [unclassified Pseudomonas]|uniref:hypothetical protein n=1 Tax=unclassified Pseudomonas TaxID=196821 RepID=UPI000C86E40A|nr:MULTISPECIES: hypothetical protein [unclassified Pseudomonas]PMU25262.1 hypothetical protein C1X90_10435 [Pseudomonas sp. GP01-A9]PMU29706.1 hypothetical protein C1X88_12180 [Pseudomonas sp. GP01-A13]PMU40813.1 hypothetical protein C1X89_11170 [Pseudomonas sp. GP01-A8]PMU49530.1 hypothetical protein C1X87_17145 [Pseudomonas sp. GP01-A14]PMU54186.1 hypothetical protein C1X85_13405 [Pseudomonas sp. GP01-A6]
MSLSGIFSSAHQRRSFLLASGGLLLLCFLATLWIANRPEQSPSLETFNSFLNSVVASGAFAILSTLYISFFVDPNEVQKAAVVLPQDISQNLERIVADSVDYQISVRTGRHFRAKTLPRLLEQAKKHRQPIRVDAILLDFRDEAICEQYARFRQSATFDSHLWSVEYVQSEVLATILAIARAKNEYPLLLNVQLYLSKRLSTFRIEGSSQELIVTREDPKDFAYRYHRSHRDYAAYAHELGLIRTEASNVDVPTNVAPTEVLQTMFGLGKIAATVITAAEQAVGGRSPYA